MPRTSAVSSIALSTMLAALLFAPSVVHAQSSDPIFKGKTVTVYIGAGAGSGYDLYGRMLARHIGDHLPGNPAMVNSNMPGAGGIVLANYIYEVAPKDGTAMAILAQTLGEEQVFGNPNVRYDAPKFSWIGRIASNVEILYVWHTVPIKTIQDVTKRETVVAGSGPSSIVYPRLLNAMMGTKFKVVPGYNTTPAAHLAMERGEVEGVTSSVNTIKTTQADWLKDKKINIIVQFAPERHADLPDIPDVVELGKTDADRQVLGFYASSAAVGRAVIAPPGMAADRLKIVRAAFDATMKDPAFLAEIRQTKAELVPMKGEEVQKIVAKAVSIDPEDKELARKFRAQP